MSKSYFDAENSRHRSFELPGAKPHYNPDRPGQVEHIFLDLSLDIPNQSYYGTCAIQLNPIRSGIERLTLERLTSIFSLCKLTTHSNHLTTTAQNYKFNSLHRRRLAIQ